MADKARKVKFRPSRLFGAAAIILIVFFGADSVKRKLYNDERHNLVIDGEFRQTIEYPTIPEPSESEDGRNLSHHSSVQLT